jgi:hypothetical protein
MTLLHQVIDLQTQRSEKKPTLTIPSPPPDATIDPSSEILLMANAGASAIDGAGEITALAVGTTSTIASGADAVSSFFGSLPEVMSLLNQLKDLRSAAKNSASAEELSAQVTSVNDAIANLYQNLIKSPDYKSKSPEDQKKSREEFRNAAAKLREGLEDLISSAEVTRAHASKVRENALGGGNVKVILPAMGLAGGATEFGGSLALALGAEVGGGAALAGGGGIALPFAIYNTVQAAKAVKEAVETKKIAAASLKSSPSRHDIAWRNFQIIR